MNLARALAIGWLFSACGMFGGGPPPQRALPPGAETFSLTGEPLYPMALPADEQVKRETKLAAAKAAYDAQPDDADALVEYGRRLGHIGRYNEAIRVFSDGIWKHADDPRMYRHRGHRYISLRRFDLAVKDLEQAAALIRTRPDEIEHPLSPNARGIELDWLHHNVHYHLGLAYYLEGDFERALPAYRACLDASKNVDSQCSAAHWLYMTLRRLGRADEATRVLAPFDAAMDVVEYHGYHRLLLVYKGEMDADQLFVDTPPTGKTAIDYATIGYGIGNWHLYNGRRERALEVFAEVSRAEAWPAFGRIASEVELARVAP